MSIDKLFKEGFDPTPRDAIESVFNCARQADLNLTQAQFREVRNIYVRHYLNYFHDFEKKYPDWNLGVISLLAKNYAERDIAGAMIGTSSAIKGVPTRQYQLNLETKREGDK